MHSTASDGTLTPKELVNKAKSIGLRAISITDHDTINGVKKVVNTKIMEVVPGIEISTDYKKQEMHILGYYIDLSDEILIEKLDWLKQMRVERAEKMLEKLQNMNIDINQEEVFKNRKIVSRRHFADALVNKKIVDSYKEAFNKYLGRRGKAFVPREKLGYKESINIIKNTGGVPILAHPGEIRTKKVMPFIKHAVHLGILGVEIFHPSNNEEMRKKLMNYCKKKDLLISGGSDFHGKGVKNRMGVENIPYMYLEKIKEIAQTT